MIFKFFESFVNPFPKSKVTAPPGALMAFCRHHIQGSGKWLIAMGILTAILAMLEVMLFGFMGDLVDWLAESERETFLTDHGGRLLLMAIIVMVVLPIVLFTLSNIKHQTLMGNFPMAIRWRGHRYLLRQSLQFYQDEFAGRVATKVMQSSLAVRHTVMTLVDVLVYVLVYFTTMIFLVGQADMRLVLPLLVWLVVYFALQVWLLPKLKRVSVRQAHARSTMTGRIVDSYTNISTVKLFSNNEQEEAYAQDAMSGFMGTVYEQMRLATMLNVSINVLNYSLAFTMAALSIWLWMNDAISVGAISVAIALALRLNGMAQWIMWEIGGLFENIGMVIDGMDMLAQPLAIKDKDDANTLVVNEGEIRFEDVEFHYGKADEKGVLSDLNLHIKPGEKVGLVGRSGAGKSTILSLLLRLYDVESGSIKIDNQRIDDVTQESLRQHIGMVTQDTSLLHRTVRENLKYGSPDASDAELAHAIKMAEAESFIDDLSDPMGNRGLDAMVGERGVKLSGGQRQRIAIARVLLKNAPILLLDEATSALDSEVEAAIQDSLYKLMEGKTVIAIAHRLSTIAALDRLIVIDAGKIIQEGTHESLLADESGLYAQLWKRQTGGYLPTRMDDM